MKVVHREQPKARIRKNRRLWIWLPVFVLRRDFMKQQDMNQEDWKAYLGIPEETEETVSADDMEGEWEDARKL